PAVADQLLVCDALASVSSADPRAAGAYAFLAATNPEAAKPVYAWLYVRAATAAGFASPQDLDLFARAFQQLAEARAFFEKNKWDFQEAEYTYLERSARQAPGQFPAALGQDYRPRGEAFLLARSLEQEKEAKLAPARASVEVLLRLAPDSVAA